MNVTIPIKKYNIDKVYFGEPIKNTIIENSVFRRTIYSDTFVSFNNICLLFELKNVYVKKYYNKWKIILNSEEIKLSIKKLERELLEKIRMTHKKSCHAITEQIEAGFIKLFSDNLEQKVYEGFNLILKVSGIWETGEGYGLTYKFTEADKFIY